MQAVSVNFREDLEEAYATRPSDEHSMIIACRECECHELVVAYDGDGSITVGCPKCHEYVTQFMVEARPTMPDGVQDA